MARRLPPVLAAIAEEFGELDTSTKALRAFGWQIGLIVLAIAGGLAWYWGEFGPIVLALLGFGGVLLVLGLTIPTALRSLYKGWMGVTLVLGFVMSHVLLAIVFFGLVTPIGLVMRLFGHDPLGRKVAPPEGTYWKDRDAYDPHDAERLRQSF
jgi:hypothetical protein